MSRPLLATATSTVTLDADKRVVRFTRSGRAHDTLDELIRDHEAVLRTLDSLDRPRLGLLIDLREAPPRNDEAFEKAMAQIRPRLFEGFARTAVLVRSAVGKLQVSRHAKQDRSATLVTQDETEALAHLAP